MRPDQQHSPSTTPDDFLLPCPFCGHEVQDLMDGLYKTGTQWFEENGCRHYLGHRMPKPVCFEARGDVWVMNCLENEGGCGACIEADSRNEVIEKWNRRTA